MIQAKEQHASTIWDKTYCKNEFFRAFGEFRNAMGMLQA